MNRIILAIALAVIIQGCASADRARGQQLGCVEAHVRVGMTSSLPETGIEYRVVELHPSDPRCSGATPVLAVIEPTSAAVREQAWREEEARQQEAQRKFEAEVAANRRRNHERELACIRAGGTWIKEGVDLYNEGNGECKARSQNLSCETYKLGDRVYTDCR